MHGCMDICLRDTNGMNAGEVRRVYDGAVAEVRRRKLSLRLPALFSKNGDETAVYTVGGLMLVFFASRVGKIADKTQLCEFLRAMQ